jgi:hypothetical protein
MAFDSVRRRVLRIGGDGTAGHPFANWLWNGAGWASTPSSRMPPARHYHALAADRARQRIVLFGGVGGIWHSDTWEWDGTDWNPLAPATIPPARANHAMAWDGILQRVVMFGGNTTVTLSDTWTWDGTNWTQLLPAASPGPHSGHAMATDRSRQRIVMFGGDTWEWDGTNWLPRFPVAIPPARSYSPMAYDDVRQRVVLFGGGTNLADTWEWDGTNWLQRQPATSPSSRLGHAIAYDEDRQEVVLFGGISYGAGTPPLPADTWEWDGSNWSQRQPPTNLWQRTAHAMAYDPVRQRTLLFGGRGYNLAFSNADTWECDGSTWVERRPAAHPGARMYHAMAVDDARQRVVLFGGSGGSGVLSDTWEWAGANWSQIFPAASPPPRTAAAMAFDALRQRITLFGGSGASLLADTWQWDGVNWAQRFPAVSPPARYGHAMAGDAVRQRIVLFGGFDTSFVPTGNRADTWEWDGSTWILCQPATNPAARGYHAMTYDAARQRVVLFGGGRDPDHWPLSYPTFFGDTWDWDGVSWTPVGSTAAPSPRYGHAMVFDATLGRCMLFGGEAGALGSNPQSDTWYFGALAAAGTTPSGIGCASGSAPALAAGLPFLGNAAFAIDLLGARGVAPCMFGFAPAPQSLAIGSGCTLYLAAPIVAAFAVTDAAGFASARATLPPDPHLRGAVLHVQALVLDPPAPLGVAFTGRLTVSLGD